MDFIEAVVVALIQGITEWLPISSEGITSIVLINFFGKTLTEAIFLSLWLHAGTLLSAIVYFRADIKQILKNLPSYAKNPRSMSGYDGITNFLIISTVMTAGVGIPLIVFSLDKINFAGGYAMALIGVLLIVTGLIQRFARPSALVSEKTRVSDSIIAGVVQAFAVFPGLSRSGLTTSALLLRKHDADYALKLSFLMSIPVIIIAEIGLAVTQAITFNVFSFVAILISFVIGLLTLDTLLKVAEKVNFGYFCIFLGGISLLAMLV